MGRIAFLLDAHLPRLYPGIEFLCIPHEGKQDLEKSVPRKLRAWRAPGVRFVVLRDNDGTDCVSIKSRIVDACSDAGRPDALVRIACQELEAWCFGDPGGLAHVFGNAKLRELGDQARFRDPDVIQTPSRQLKDIVPEFQKIPGARMMGAIPQREGNSFRSYQVLLDGIERLRS